MAKPKFQFEVMVERVVKVPYTVTAKDEKDALRQIKKNAKAGQKPCDVACLGETAEFGKLVKPATWSVRKVEE